jgi:hypothetical protein
MRLLQDGWLEGHGTAPAQSGLNWLSKAFDEHYPDDLPLPYLYPTEDGGVQAEWSLHGHELSCEIDLVSKLGQWHMLNMKTGQDESCELNLSDNDGWNGLIDKIKQFNGSMV